MRVTPKSSVIVVSPGVPVPTPGTTVETGASVLDAWWLTTDRSPPTRRLGMRMGRAWIRNRLMAVNHRLDGARCAACHPLRGRSGRIPAEGDQSPGFPQRLEPFHSRRVALGLFPRPESSGVAEERKRQSGTLLRSTGPEIRMGGPAPLASPLARSAPSEAVRPTIAGFGERRGGHPVGRGVL